MDSKKVAQSLYEAWMDGKDQKSNEDEERADSGFKHVTLSRKSKFAYDNAYRQSISKSPSPFELKPNHQALEQPVRSQSVLCAAQSVPLRVPPSRKNKNKSLKRNSIAVGPSRRQNFRAKSAQTNEEDWDEVEFTLFYRWVTNGKESDINEETIIALLFKKNQGKKNMM
ncbi:unnamed protein product, partial [Mesorhabditis belari]|uniref:Uncharacterized protein n=1 Tax=Mesorhabditis belari TaxID=2138241 RepID=A0AAF3F3Q5_9BILA